MAHADYDCCAICDRKMGYAGLNAETKGKICSTCTANLAEEGVIIHDWQELIEWIKETDKETVEEVLQAVGFEFCYYSNYVDETVKEKGIDRSLL